MNWKTILALSTFGLAMGTGLGLGIFSEESLWVRAGIPLSLSLWIGARIEKKLFLHGFLVGVIGESLKMATIFLLFPGYATKNFPGISGGGRYFLSLMLFYNMNIGVWLGFLSWLVADIKPYAITIGRRIKGEKFFRVVFYIITALSLFFASLFCFFMLLSSCAGHGPRSLTWLGYWLFPICAIAAWIFYRLGKFVLKKGFPSPPEN